jgi:hypothetical protein
MRCGIQGFLLGIWLLFTSCQTDTLATAGNGLRVSSEASERAKTEPPGEYFVGRRLVGKRYYFWGYVKKPGENWEQAKLVMLNEKSQLAPDRARGAIGSDNNFEYRLYGYFSGDRVYEPASGRFFPEFVLKKAELIDSNPPTIFPPNYVEQQKMFANWPLGALEPGTP